MNVPYKNDCLKCGYKWFPRKAQRPKSCPHCYSRLWHTFEGRTFYGFGHIAIGAQFVYDGGFSETNFNIAIKKALRIYSRRTGKYFIVSSKYLGLAITRII